jgi:hypothetical protein
MDGEQGIMNSVLWECTWKAAFQDYRFIHLYSKRAAFGFPEFHLANTAMRRDAEDSSTAQCLKMDDTRFNITGTRLLVSR